MYSVQAWEVRSLYSSGPGAYYWTSHFLRRAPYLSYKELYLTHYETAHIPSKTIHGKFDLITELLAEEFGGGGAGETCIFLDRRNRFNY